MRPMSASELQEIALDIAPEVNRLNRLESQMRLVQAAMLTNPALADICAESLAIKLHNFYTAHIPHPKCHNVSKEEGA